MLTYSRITQQQGVMKEVIVNGFRVYERLCRRSGIENICYSIVLPQRGGL